MTEKDWNLLIIVSLIIINYRNWYQNMFVVYHTSLIVFITIIKDRFCLAVAQGFLGQTKIVPLLNYVKWVVLTPWGWHRLQCILIWGLSTLEYKNGISIAIKNKLKHTKTFCLQAFLANQIILHWYFYEVVCNRSPRSLIRKFHFLSAQACTNDG